MENTLQQMIIGARDGEALSPREVPLAIRQHPDLVSEYIRVPSGTPMHDVERIMIEKTLEACDHDKNACAETLGIGLRTLYRKLNEYNTPD
jgi:DNA-binding NtrC family response regulator